MSQRRRYCIPQPLLSRMKPHTHTSDLSLLNRDRAADGFADFGSTGSIRNNDSTIIDSDTIFDLKAVNLCGICICIYILCVCVCFVHVLLCGRKLSVVTKELVFSLDWTRLLLLAWL